MYIYIYIQVYLYNYMYIHSRYIHTKYVNTYIYIYTLNTFTLLTCSSKSENYVERCANHGSPCIPAFVIFNSAGSCSGEPQFNTWRPFQEMIWQWQ